MRNKLILRMAAANKTEDVYLRLAMYNQILTTPRIDSYLNTKEMADMYYNRSLAHVEVSGLYFYNSQYVEAIQTMRCADSDVRNAHIRYTSFDDRQACLERMAEYRRTRLHVIAVKNDPDPDRSMAAFASVSRLHMMLPETQTVCSDVEDVAAAECSEVDTTRAAFVPLSRKSIFSFFELADTAYSSIKPVKMRKYGESPFSSRSMKADF